MKNQQLFMGVDPDTKSTGVAAQIVYGDKSTKWFLGASESTGRLAIDRLPGMAKALAIYCTDEEWDWPVELAVEYQHIRPREKNPNAIMAVQAVAGMAVAAIVRTAPLAKVYLPIPSEWKGSVPKEVMHERILKEAGLTYESAEFASVPKHARSHVTDGIGLVLWLRRGRRLR